MSPAATIATTCLIALGTCSCTPADPPPLNVVLIVIDDLGWMDSGTYGSTFYETPNIDRLASEGVRYTDFYTASSVCSPTRASLMTGKHPARLDLTNWIGGEQSGLLDQAEYIRELPLSEVTVGEAFQAAGYQTGYVGKWHLGGAEFLPDAQGFDYMFAVNEAGQPGAYFPPYENPNYAVTNVPDLDGDPEGTYLTDRLTDVTIDFLTEHQEEPFFFVLSHYAVHTPLQAKPEVTARYADKAEDLGPVTEADYEAEREAETKLRQDHPTYAAMIESTDQSVGRILDALDDLELWERTIVMFVSDNGGLSTLMRRSPTQATSNLPLRAGKGWLYEGGIRAPLIVRTPGVPAGGLVSDHPASSTDLYPTLLALAGLPARPEQHVDGVSLAAALTAGEAARDTLYWHFPHYHGSGNRPGGAIRAGNFKLVEWFEDGSVDLYDLATDLSEDHDLATERPEDTQRLQDRLHAWRAKVGANMPTARN
ncbi:MAG: sulfatase-like hydrolase/transferase [Proteobacteria bacterium]|nr:sulfatase-like hydrolase/transferase [Pseudomonadota bacterium]